MGKLPCCNRRLQQEMLEMLPRKSAVRNFGSSVCKVNSSQSFSQQFTELDFYHLITNSISVHVHKCFSGKMSYPLLLHLVEGNLCWGSFVKIHFLGFHLLLIILTGPDLLQAMLTLFILLLFPRKKKMQRLFCWFLYCQAEVLNQDTERKKTQH